MKTPTVNGRSIEHYKDFDVLETGLAVPRAEPLYAPAISNGYAPDDIVLDGLVLNLPLYLLKGSKFKSVDRYGHTCTVTGAVWRPNHRYFDGSDDVLNCGNASILQTVFGGDTTTALTCIWWQRLSGTPDANRGIWIKGADPAFWGLWWDSSGKLQFERKVTGTTDDCFVNWADGYAAGDADKWKHFALIVNGRAVSDISLYKDLVLLTRTDVSDTLSSDVANTSDDLYKPGRAWGASERFKEDLGEYMGYNRGLSLAEITHNRNTTIWRYQ